MLKWVKLQAAKSINHRAASDGPRDQPKNAPELTISQMPFELPSALHFE